MTRQRFGREFVQFAKRPEFHCNPEDDAVSGQMECIRLRILAQMK